MSLSTAYITAKVKGMRTTLPCATIQMRYQDLTWSGIGGTIAQERWTDDGGNMFKTTGYVRLVISELPDRLPKSGDKVQVKNADDTEWIVRILTDIRKDEAGASLYCGYGEREDD